MKNSSNDVSAAIPSQTDVLVLAAGKGERLRPLTDSLPKPLVTVAGKTLLERNLRQIARAGFRRVFINLHYLGEQIERFVGDGSRFGLSVEYSHEPVLLDTGGAIKKIEPRVHSEHLLTLNADILVTDELDLAAVLRVHVEDPRRPFATLVLREDKDAERFGVLEMDETRRIVRFLDVTAPADPIPFTQARAEPHSQPPQQPANQGAFGKTEVIPRPKLIYIGVQVVSRRLFAELPGRDTPFSITRDCYRGLIRAGSLLAGVRYDGYWSDIGTPERLERASKQFVE